MDLNKQLNAAGLELIDQLDNGALLVTNLAEGETKIENKQEPISDQEKALLLSPEIGTTKSLFSAEILEEQNAALRGLNGLRTYKKMRTDSAVRSSLSTLKTPIIGATWFFEAASDDPEDQLAADFLQKNFDLWMTYSWHEVLLDALLSLDYGFYAFEKVFDYKTWNGREYIYLKKLGSRHPLTIPEEEGFKYDKNGGPVSVSFFTGETDQDITEVPIEKLLIVTYDKEAGDLRGNSILRSAYKHWYFAEAAYKIDGIQKERHSIGVPIIKLPLNFTPKDVAEAQAIGRNLRANQLAHIVLPPGWELEFAKMEGNPVSALATAEYHSQMIFTNIIAQAMWTSRQQDADTMMNFFLRFTRKVAGDMLEAINRYLIPQLIDLNFEVSEYPKMRVRRLGDTQEARELSFTLRNMVGSKVIVPDDELESWAREIIDAPKKDEETSRSIDEAGEEPQEPNIGLPRQSNAGNQRIEPSKPNAQQAGA